MATADFAWPGDIAWSDGDLRPPYVKNDDYASVAQDEVDDRV